MDLLPSPEQQDIISSADGLLEKEAPLRRVRELSETEAVVDRELWRRYGALGWFGLGLEESAGGVGFSIAEEALLFREIGRHLAPGPFLATVLGARVALGAGLTALVSEILEGNVVVALAEPHGDPDARIGRELSGHFRLMDAIDAEFLVAVGREGAALLDAAAGSSREPVASLDPTVRFSTAELLTPALGFVDAGHDPIYGRGTVLVAAMLAGITEATRDASVEYAKVRQQFGQPIGVFQAVSHRCATMAVRAEAASSLTLYAALALAGRAPDASFQASAARAVATEAAIANAGDNIQNHGGMGFTDEHDAHLFLKRAHVLDQTLGTARRHLRQLLDEPPAQ